MPSLDHGWRAIHRRSLLSGVLLAPLLILSRPSRTADHEQVVIMRNKGTTGLFVFEPAVLHVAPGDSIRFEPENPGHNSESIAGMVPAGAEGWKGKINQAVSATLVEPGVYGYRCHPHYAMGMVGLIVVGDASVNLAEAKAVKHLGKAGKTFEALFSRLA